MFYPMKALENKLVSQGYFAYLVYATLRLERETSFTIGV